MERMSDRRARPGRAERRARAASPAETAPISPSERAAQLGDALRRGLIGSLVAVTAVALAEHELAGSAAPGPSAEALISDVGSAAAPSPSELLPKAPAHVPLVARRAISHAAATVGVDRRYLFAVAARESSFDSAAYERRTSAAGLYQFTEDTWLRVVKAFGARFGLGVYAAEISLRDDGSVTMPKGPRRERLMKLRFDPRLSALMAAELARDNEHRLAHILGRKVSPAETYIAHFLGVGPAARMITAAADRPRIAAARIVPAAAKANPALFRKEGKAASAASLVAEIEAYFRDEAPKFEPA